MCEPSEAHCYRVPQSNSSCAFERQYSSSVNSLETCAAVCKTLNQDGSVFAGVTSSSNSSGNYGEDCWCSTSTADCELAPPLSCEVLKCSGNHNETCGSSQHLKVYGSNCTVAAAALDTKNPENTGFYPKTYFILYLLHSGYIIYIPLWAVLQLVLRMLVKHTEFVGTAWLPPNIGRKFLHATVLNFFLCVSDFLWYQSLACTVVAANNAIYQSAAVFVFVMSFLLIDEKVRLHKVAALMIASVGIVLVTLFTKNEEGSKIYSAPIGYVLVLISVIVFAFYEVVFKRLEGGHGEADETCIAKTQADTMLFLSLMGVSNAVFMWIGLPILHHVGLELFWAPPNQVITKLVVNTGLGAVYSLFLLLAVALTSPLFVSVGTMLIIPIGIAVEKLLHDYTIGIWPLVGCCLIITAFFVLQLEMLKTCCTADKANPPTDDSA